MAFSDEAIVFFSNQIGQVVIILAAIIAGMKYIERVQSNKIKDQIKDQLTPVMTELKAMVIEVEHNLQQDRIKYNERIRNLFFRMNRLENGDYKHEYPFDETHGDK